MAENVRCFIAAKIPATPPLREVLEALGEMGRAVKPVSADNLHVTLKFFGDVPREQTAAIGRTLQEVTASVEAFEVTLKGLGAFPHPGRPSVIWAGMDEAEPLIQLAAELEDQLESQGFVRESRPFHPHLTLARIKARPPESLRGLLQQCESSEFGAAHIDHVDLYESELRREGPVYTVLARGELEA
ncbi:2'-5'-RNA ligase [Maioricimonas rarisocia]|uniref:RNA 2',3'-cyclic phosphodiesterase n=1 Tax=Maioricimonas rarisocia TaxID=2528026 RepID=A0A517Z279_9PLAN|nr:RNA 2',3'-cyclic phosphodiesterase [Maioricimonas rarisocia]QDU36581.1 2'-5'-RNA ligase [Maioricimonas rarisocia]